MHRAGRLNPISPVERFCRAGAFQMELLDTSLASHCFGGGQKALAYAAVECFGRHIAKAEAGCRHESHTDKPDTIECTERNVLRR